MLVLCRWADRSHRGLVEGGVPSVGGVAGLELRIWIACMAAVKAGEVERTETAHMHKLQQNRDVSLTPCPPDAFTEPF